MRNSLKYILAAASMLMGVAAYAAGDGDDNGLRVNKTRSEVDANGNYTLTLTSFAVGEQTPNMVKPTVHVSLVLDVSGSMKQQITKICDGDRATVNRELDKTKPSGYYSYGYSNQNFPMSYNTSRLRWEYGTNGTGTQIPESNTNAASVYLTESGTRLDAMKNATKTFIDEVAKQANESGKTHELYIYRFGAEGLTAKVYEGHNYTTAKTNVDNLTLSTYTYTNKGLEAAYGKLKEVKGTAQNPVARVVLLFTDGAPSASTTRPASSFDGTVANNAITQAYNLKHLPYDDATGNPAVQLYGVNVYPDSDNQMHTFMNYVSSNFPNATDMATPGAGGKNPATEPHDYYKTASTASELEEIFKAIAGSLGGGSNFKPGGASVVVKDVLTPSFTIPEGGQVKIYVDDVKTAPAHPTNSKESDYSFTKSTTPASGLTPKIEGKTVSVEGFDFAANWVGYKYLNETQTQKELHGKQLRIEIIVHKSAESEGGYEDTNDPSSGIYVGGENWNPYPIPDVVFTNLVDLVITRSGMKAGETSIYQVKGGSIDMLVPVTAVNDTDPAKTVVNVAVNSTDDPKGDQIEYTVSEKTDWSWANSEETTSVSKKLARIDASGRIHNDNHFEFGVESTSDVIAHDEDNAKIN